MAGPSGANDHEQIAMIDAGDLGYALRMLGISSGPRSRMLVCLNVALTHPREQDKIAHAARKHVYMVEYRRVPCRQIPAWDWPVGRQQGEVRVAAALERLENTNLVVGPPTPTRLASHSSQERAELTLCSGPWGALCSKILAAKIQIRFPPFNPETNPVSP
ncbi:hypothetical protein VTI74DRAFT_11463 [Chaetomium olivicolor]